MNKEKIVSDVNKQIIIEYCSKIREYLRLDEWEADIVFYDFDKEDILAEICILESYLHCIIRVNEELTAKIIKENETEKLIDGLIHEFIHIIIDPLYRLAIDAQNNSTMPFLEEKREQAVCRVTGIILKEFKEPLVFI